MAETVAFLFADVVGSTRLVVEAGAERYARILTDYRSIVERSVAAESGRVIDREGDGIFLVVPTAGGALRAAVAAQRGLDALDRREDVDVRVRMGIHVGEAHAHDEGYVGLEINRAARIAALAEGGEILVSETARLLAADTLPDDVELHDLGERELRGIDRRERVHRLTLPSSDEDPGSRRSSADTTGTAGGITVWAAHLAGLPRDDVDDAAAVRRGRLLQERTRVVVARHGGTLLRSTTNSVLVSTPDPHEALHGALELIADLRGASLTGSEPVLLGAGVHHDGGDVVDPDGALETAITIAEGLADEAPPGQVVASESVWREVNDRDDVRFESLGALDVEAGGAPVWAYAVTPANADPGPGVRTTVPGRGGESLAEARSLAILPFEVVGSSDDAEFLAIGLHNDLLAELSKVPELTVISRTSVLGYRGTDRPIPRIAEELGVGTVIEGALQSAGDRVRLTVQVIDGVNDAHRWAESYDRELTTTDLFDIQTELAERITESLHAELVTSAAATEEAGASTTDLDAYRLAAQGRLQFDLKTEEGFLRAIELFEEAIELDPRYAEAWIGLADSLALMEDYGYGDREELLARAEVAAHRALALAPDSAGAHCSLGLLYSTYQRGPETVREFEHAIRLQPSYADAHNWHAWISLILGRGRVALESARRAVEVNPLSAEPVSNVSLAHLAVGQPQEALTVARRASELSPFTTSTFFEGIALYDLGRHEEAHEVLEPLAVRSAGELTVPWAKHGPDVTLALTLAHLDEPDEARAVLDTIDTAEHPLAAGLIHLGLGETDRALDAFTEVDLTTAWPNLALHHHYRDVWARIEGTDAHRALLRTAHRSWGLDGD